MDLGLFFSCSLLCLGLVGLDLLFGDGLCDVVLFSNFDL